MPLGLIKYIIIFDHDWPLFVMYKNKTILVNEKVIADDLIKTVNHFIRILKSSQVSY